MIFHMGQGTKQYMLIFHGRLLTPKSMKSSRKRIVMNSSLYQSHLKLLSLEREKWEMQHFPTIRALDEYYLQTLSTFTSLLILSLRLTYTHEGDSLNGIIQCSSHDMYIISASTTLIEYNTGTDLLSCLRSRELNRGQ